MRPTDANPEQPMPATAVPCLDPARRVHTSATGFEPSPKGDTACAFALVTDRDAFDALEPEWTDLFDRAGRGTQVFQTFNWNWHWCNHYLGDGSQGSAAPALAVVTARRAGHLVMVWPLAVERVAGLRNLIWMGAPVSQYGDVLMEEGIDAAPLLRQAWSFITEQVRPDLAWLRKVRDDATVAPLLAELGALSTQRLEAPYVDLAAADDFDAHLQRRSAHFRKKQRASAKRLSALGSVAYEQCSGGRQAADYARDAIALKRVQLQAGGVVSPAVADPRMSAFFADAADGCGHPAGLHFVTLASNGQLAAVDIFIGCKDRAALHIVAYDLQFEKASVGALLLQHVVARAFADGFRTFDFLAPADSYKLRWADGTAGVNDWVVPLSLKGRAFARLYLALVRPAIKSAIGALPMSLRRALAAAWHRQGPNSNQRPNGSS
jgi:CelD/BcsL family acetyltransferase involved in cellulose biosynthesis